MKTIFFFLESTCACVLGPWPWPRAFLSLASKASVLGKAVVGFGLGFFLCLWPWPWPRALCPRLHLWFIVYLVMTPMFSIFTFAIKFDCVFLTIFESFHLFVSFFIFNKLAPSSLNI